MSSKLASASSSANDSPTDPVASSTTNEIDKTCVVCFKIVDIFSIGECDHPVCYECSTRMRVLCKQNECPICRRINQKVIFTSEILPYRELDQKNRSGLYDKTFRISFSGQRTQNAFQRLLEHRCNKCNKGSFETGVVLKDHLRKEHELFYCDICTEHLKIFSFERRAYTREQLAMHRRKGDPDNKSHRGHPLCEYCDQRYLDRDELFRHLRKEHYFCHFCDADGSNHFYADHTSLREHFIDQHYLCEEADCKENIFTAAFRSEIDLKAHKANVHGQTSKQARTIDLQFNLAPRNRPTTSRQDDSTNVSGLAPHTEYDPTPISARRVIDAQNEQEFPSLGNAPVTIRPTVALNTRQFGSSGLARTKENFPALGGNDSAPRVLSAPNLPNASAILFKTPAPAKPSTNNASNASSNAKQKLNIVKSVSDFPALPGGNAPSSSRSFESFNVAAVKAPATKASSAKQKQNATIKTARDFPSLGTAYTASSRSSNNISRDLESDLIVETPAYDLSTVSSKHRALVQSYESVSSSGQVNQKINTVQRVESKAQTSNPDFVPLINSKKSFPALGGGGNASTNTSAPQWLNATNTTKTKKEPVQSKKSKVAPAPLLPTSKSTKSNGENNLNGGSDTSKKVGKAKSAKEGDNVTATKSDAKQKPNAKPTKKTNVNAESNTNKENNGDKTKTSNQKSKKANTSNGIASNHLLNGYEDAVALPSPLNETINSYSSVATFTVPPPGFPVKPKAKTIRAPPGFESALTDSQPTTFAYISPSNALQRNQMLISHFTKSLNASAVDEFRTVSRMFRESCCNARAYYEHCEVVLGERFENIFPELLVLLPDINKQQELMEIYMQKHDDTDTRLIGYIQVCELCRQVLKRSDFNEHWKFHEEIEKDNKLNKNFPKLSTAAKK